jgi:hypothetical protein
MGIKFTQNTTGQTPELVVDEEAMAKFKKDLRRAYALAIKDKVIKDAIPSLGPKNFEGEAIDFLTKNKFPITEKGLPEIKGIRPAIPGLKQVQINILNEFIKHVDNMIFYDETDDMIYISPFITALEFGDFYRPILKTLTRAMEDLLRA